jgi:hypothetical protein
MSSAPVEAEVVPGDVVLAYAGTKPDRPCVVLRVSNDGALVVIPGTKTDRGLAAHLQKKIASASLIGKRMSLHFDTCFYNEIERVPRPVRKIGSCPGEVFAALRKLVGDC